MIVPESRKPSFRWVGVPAAVLLHQPAPMGPVPTEDPQQGQPPPPRLGSQPQPPQPQQQQDASPSSGETTGAEDSSSPSVHTSPPSFAGAEHVPSVRTSLAMAIHDNTSVGEMGPPPPAGGAPPSYPYHHSHLLTSRMPTNPEEWQHWEGSSPEDDDEHRGQQPHQLMPTGGQQQQLNQLKPRDRLASWGSHEPGYLRGLGMDVEPTQQQEQQQQPEHMMAAAAAMEEPEGPAGEPARGPPRQKRATPNGKQAMGHPTQTVQL